MRLSLRRDPTAPYVGRSTTGAFDEDEWPCVVFTSPPRVRICGYTRVSGRSGVRRGEALRRGACCQKISWLHISALCWQIVSRCRVVTANLLPIGAQLLHVRSRFAHFGRSHCSDRAG